MIPCFNIAKELKKIKSGSNLLELCTSAKLWTSMPTLPELLPDFSTQECLPLATRTRPPPWTSPGRRHPKTSGKAQPSTPPPSFPKTVHKIRRPRTQYTNARNLHLPKDAIQAPRREFESCMGYFILRKYP